MGKPGLQGHTHTHKHIQEKKQQQRQEFLVLLNVFSGTFSDAIHILQHRNGYIGSLKQVSTVRSVAISWLQMLYTI